MKICLGSLLMASRVCCWGLSVSLHADARYKLMLTIQCAEGCNMYWQLHYLIVFVWWVRAHPSTHQTSYCSEFRQSLNKSHGAWRDLELAYGVWWVKLVENESVQFAVTLQVLCSQNYCNLQKAGLNEVGRQIKLELLNAVVGIDDFLAHDFARETSSDMVDFYVN